MEPIIKVMLADDRNALLDRYERYIQRDPCMQVVSKVKSGYEAVMEAERLRPDVILMDIEMESRDAGILASQQILKCHPEIRIIMLTIHDSDGMIFAAFQVGVCDYLLKTANAQKVISSIRDAYLNQSPIRPEIAGRIRYEFQRLKDCESQFIHTLKIISQITPAEMEVLTLFSLQKTREDICDIRHVEMSTLKSQIHSLLRKLGARSIPEALDSLEKMGILQMVLRNRG